MGPMPEQRVAHSFQIEQGRWRRLLEQGSSYHPMLRPKLARPLMDQPQQPRAQTPRPPARQHWNSPLPLRMKELQLSRLPAQFRLEHGWLRLGRVVKCSLHKSLSTPERPAGLQDLEYQSPTRLHYSGLLPGFETNSDTEANVGCCKDARPKNKRVSKLRRSPFCGAFSRRLELHWCRFSGQHPLPCSVPAPVSQRQNSSLSRIHAATRVSFSLDTSAQIRGRPIPAKLSRPIAR